MSLLFNEQPALPGLVLASLSGLGWKAVTRPAHTQESIQEAAEAGDSAHRGWLPQDTEDTERLPFGEFQPGGCVAQIPGTDPVFMNGAPSAGRHIACPCFHRVGLGLQVSVGLNM